VDDAITPTAPRDGRGDLPAVACDGVVIRYGETVAVDRLTLAGRAGTVVALLGPNGAGKTSTVRWRPARSESSASTPSPTTPPSSPISG
jgi:ABC-type molybdenum transport system ATPase subunit/photorepair protein PhrA